MFIFPEKNNSLFEIFGKNKNIVIGMIHCKPLPGSPHYAGSMKEVIESALYDAKILVENGIDGLMIENAGDIPFLNPRDANKSIETVAALSSIARLLKENFKVPIGCNVLANAGLAAIAIAAANELNWIRVNQWANAYVANEGFVEGEAGKILRYRENLKASSIKIFTDVLVKHGAHEITSDRSLEEQAKDLIWFDTDGIIVTGQRTGDSPNIDELKRIRKITNYPILVGSGVNSQNILEIFKYADAVIVGTSLKKDNKWWNPVDEKKVKELIKKRNEIINN